jgi:molybdate transport system substrate-binding protein
MHLAVVIALAVVALLPLHAQQPAARVRVAAASDLRFALDEIAAAFRRSRPDVAVDVTYGASGTFHAQIMQGAPFDLFLSADVEYPRDLVAKGRADGETLFTYAIGRIVLWAPAGSPLDLTQGLEVLRDARVRRIAIANPLHAPYGRAAQAAMRSARAWEAAQPKLVLGENMTQAAQFVESGAADIGIVAHSLALAPQMRAKGKYWEIPQALYPVMEQAGVIVTGTGSRPGADAFRTFVMGAESRAVLTRFGFVLPRR